jgi:hypothetical protein
MNAKKTLKILALSAALTSPALFAATLTDNGANWTGVTGVILNGISYDAQFKFGTCAQVYGVCDTQHFAFNRADDGVLMNQIAALVIAQGNYSLPGRDPIYGSGFGTPTAGGMLLSAISASIGSVEAQAVYAGGQFYQPEQLSSISTHNSYAFALWSLSSAPGVPIYQTVPSVPIPAAAWLFGSGLIGLAGARRKRQNTIV